MDRRVGEELRCPACDCLLFIPNGAAAECADCGHELSFEDFYRAEPITDDDLLTLREPYC